MIVCNFLFQNEKKNFTQLVCFTLNLLMCHFTANEAQHSTYTDMCNQREIGPINGIDLLQTIRCVYVCLCLWRMMKKIGNHKLNCITLYLKQRASELLFCRFNAKSKSGRKTQINCEGSIISELIYVCIIITFFIWSASYLIGIFFVAEHLGDRKNLRRKKNRRRNSISIIINISHRNI